MERPLRATDRNAGRGGSRSRLTSASVSSSSLNTSVSRSLRRSTPLFRLGLIGWVPTRCWEGWSEVKSDATEGLVCGAGA